MGWVDPEQMDDVWPDAPSDANDVTAVLEAAYGLCRAYLPAARIAEYEATRPAAPPAEWRMAQAMWAQHLWSRKEAGNRATLGGSEMSMGTYMLVVEAKGLLRPRRFGAIR